MSKHQAVKRRSGECCHNCDHSDDSYPPLENGNFRVHVLCTMLSKVVPSDGWCEDYD